jgi:hypothetical protein
MRGENLVFNKACCKMIAGLMKFLALFCRTIDADWVSGKGAHFY